MKRTFTFTIESEEDHAAIAAHVRDLLETAWFVRSADVTETTAVHAKEREVIEAALEQFDAAKWLENGPCTSWIDTTSKTESKARELRALMEGKA